jgi:hypothetical protein
VRPRGRTWAVIGVVAGILALVGHATGARRGHSADNSMPSIGARPAVSAPTSQTLAAPPTTTLPLSADGTATGSCHARGSGLYELPDAACTPGVANPAIAQANIAQTICVAGWTDSVRPPQSYTEPLKHQQLVEYGDPGPVRDYEEDHLVPLELGGSPSNPQNLWPEPGASPNPKDAVEDAANHAVCAGHMSLAAAQQAIASDWVALGQRLGVVSASVRSP